MTKSKKYKKIKKTRKQNKKKKDNNTAFRVPSRSTLIKNKKQNAVTD